MFDTGLIIVYSRDALQQMCYGDILIREHFLSVLYCECKLLAGGYLDVDHVVVIDRFIVVIVVLITIHHGEFNGAAEGFTAEGREDSRAASPPQVSR